MTDIRPLQRPRASVARMLKRTWTSMSREGRKTAFGRATASLGAFGLVAAGLPVVSDINAERLDDQRFRINNERLAVEYDAGQVMRTDPTAPALLQHSWLRSVEYSLVRDPVSALSPSAALERDRAALDGLKSFDPGHMVRADEIARQTQCLAEAVYYEARSESLFGQIGVAEVISNRVRDHRFPNTICEVVYQGATRTTGCQFTFTCDGALSRAPKGWRWEQAQSIAAHVIMDLNELQTAGATHYHATYVDPVWNSGLIRTTRIGRHIFYRFPRGAEWALANARQRDRLARRRASLASYSSGPVGDVVSVIETRPSSAAPASVGLTAISEIPVDEAALQMDEESRSIQISPLDAEQGAAPVT